MSGPTSGATSRRRHPTRGPSQPAGRKFLSALAVSLNLVLLAGVSAAAANESAPLDGPARANASLAGKSADFLLKLVKGSLNPLQQQVAPNVSLGRPLAKPANPLRRLGHMDQKTEHVCEGNRMELRCPEGKSLHIGRAIYGRFSVSICNELGASNLNVQCFAIRTSPFISDACNNKSSCSVTASNENFGDPCEGTSKYLEVQYHCLDANGQQQQASASSPNRHQQQQQQHHQANQLQPDTMAAPGNQPSGGHKSPQQSGQPVVGGSTDAQQQQQPARDGDEQLVARPQASSSVIQPAASCAPQASVRGLYWNATRADQTARQPCPNGATGSVSWQCDGQRLRFTPSWSPDFGACRSIWLQRLAEHLNRLLEAPSSRQPAEWARQQSELRAVLRDLELMTRTKELFSEDLKRIDIMISQILAQLRSLSVVFGPGAGNSLPAGAAWRPQTAEGPTSSLYEELFVRLVSIVSQLFELSQRSAWLELQAPELRRRLELRLLNHLRDAGAMLVGASQPDEQPLATAARQPNLVAGFAVIGAGGLRLRSPAPQVSVGAADADTGELSLQLGGQPASFGSGQLQESLGGEQMDELRVHTTLLRELVSNGVTRLLILDVKKPDYSLLRQQLDSSYATQGDSLATIMDNNNNNLFSESSTRIYGVFAIQDSGELLLAADSAPARPSGSSSTPASDQELRLAETLAQWPISVDFKVRQFAGQPTSWPASQQPRQCNSLGDIESVNRCRSSRSNATNHVCRCDRLAFVQLSQTAGAQQPNGLVQEFAWPPVLTGGQPDPFEPLAAGDNQPPAFIGAHQSSGKQAQQPLGLAALTFIVLGISLLVLTVGALLLQAALRASAQSRLNKKQSFLSTGSSILAGPTTSGPLAESIVQSSAGSLVGLGSGQPMGAGSCPAAAYKSHQQLYAAHLPPIEGYALAGACAPSNRLLRLARYLRPSRWLASLAKSDQRVQHTVIGSSLANPMGSVTFKSQYQNGYTTNLHQSAALGQLAPLNGAPSSSTSSYVSSSAYYEEIGPGNLTKVNTSQLAGPSRGQTSGEPFKRPTAADQQQLLSSGLHQHHHQHQQQQQHLHQHQLQQPAHHIAHHQTLHHPWSAGAHLASYPAEAQHLQGSQAAYGQPMQLAQSGANSGKPHNDLSQLQSSSSSSAGSQHSASTNLTSANPMSPRHLLFASPSAANAYKSSVSQQQSLHHHQTYHHH